MTDEITISEDGARALREAENYCWRSNVAIVTPEHLLAGALLVLGAMGVAGIPDVSSLNEAVLAVHGSGSEPLHDTIRFGSAAREALNAMAEELQEAGGTVVDARVIASGVIESGEVNPMFYSALGERRDQLLAAVRQAF